MNEMAHTCERISQAQDLDRSYFTSEKGVVRTYVRVRYTERRAFVRGIISLKFLEENVSVNRVVHTLDPTPGTKKNC